MGIVLSEYGGTAMSNMLVQHRTRFPRLTSWVLAATLATLAVGCAKGADVTEILAEARTAAFQGNLEEAIAAYERVLEIEPENVSALLGLADIEIQQGNLDGARAHHEILGTLELIPSDQQRVDQSRNRLWQLIYDQSKGDGPANPADPEQYENAIINLYNADPSEERALEISQRFAFVARAALGAEDVTVPMSQNQALLDAATIEQIRAALAAYRRLITRDPRLMRVLLTDEEIRREAEAMEVILTERVFLSDFATLFETNTREQLIAVEGFVADTNKLRLLLEDQYDGPRLAEDELEQFKETQALLVVIQNLNSLALQVRGAEAEGIPNPPMRLFGEGQAQIAEFFAGYEIVSFEMTRRGQVTLEVLIPLDLLLKTAYRQEEYIEWWKAQHAQEGTGSGAPVVPEEGAPAAPEEGTGTAPEEAASPAGEEVTAPIEPEEVAAEPEEAAAEPVAVEPGDVAAEPAAVEPEEAAGEESTPAVDETAEPAEGTAPEPTSDGTEEPPPE